LHSFHCVFILSLTQQSYMVIWLCKAAWPNRSWHRQVPDCLDASPVITAYWFCDSGKFTDLSVPCFPHLHNCEMSTQVKPRKLLQDSLTSYVTSVRLIPDTE
jgi:hypothetical protein